MNAAEDAAEALRKRTLTNFDNGRRRVRQHAIELARRVEPAQR